jgi:hypothetical protein
MQEQIKKVESKLSAVEQENATLQHQRLETQMSIHELQEAVAGVSTSIYLTIVDIY